MWARSSLLVASELGAWNRALRGSALLVDPAGIGPSGGRQNQTCCAGVSKETVRCNESPVALSSRPVPMCARLRQHAVGGGSAAWLAGSDLAKKPCRVEVPARAILSPSSEEQPVRVASHAQIERTEL